MDVVANELDDDQLLAQHFRSGQTSSHQFIREESITERIARALFKRFREYTDFTLFTPHEESRNGTDWYWRFQIDDLSIHAHVQAKRIQRTMFGQADKDGIVELDTEQIERLLDVAADARKRVRGLQTWIATYARFDATPPCGKNPVNCSTHGCNLACQGTTRQPSIWIAKASDFAGYGRRSRQMMRMNEIAQNSIRLDCLLPCIESGTTAVNRIGPMVKDFVLAPNLMSYESSIEAIRGDSALSDEFKGALKIKV